MIVHLPDEMGYSFICLRSAEPTIAFVLIFGTNLTDGGVSGYLGQYSTFWIYILPS
jgi:hypothetical protein